MEATTSPTDTTRMLTDYHPDAPRPPFIWTAQLPTSWRVIHTHPAQWKLAAQRLAEDYIPGVRLRPAQRKVVLEKIEETVVQAQKAGVLMALVLPGLIGDQVSAATLLLRWVDSAPTPASVLSAQKQLEHKNPTTEKTGSGHSYVFVSSTQRVGPLSQLREVHTHQAFLPVPGTTWTLVVSGSAPEKDLSDLVANIVRRVITNVEVFPTTDGETLDSLAEISDADDTDRTDNADGTGSTSTTDAITDARVTDAANTLETGSAPDTGDTYTIEATQEGLYRA